MNTSFGKADYHVHILSVRGISCKAASIGFPFSVRAGAPSIGSDSIVGASRSASSSFPLLKKTDTHLAHYDTSSSASRTPLGTTRCNAERPESHSFAIGSAIAHSLALVPYSYAVSRRKQLPIRVCRISCETAFYRHYTRRGLHRLPNPSK